MPCSGSRAQLTLLLRAKIPDDSSCFLFNKQSYKQSVCVCRLGAGGRGQGEINFFRCYSPGGHSPIWPIWVCAAEQGMVFRLLSLTGCLFGPEALNRGCEFWRCAVYVCDKGIFLNNLILFCQ